MRLHIGRLYHSQVTKLVRECNEWMKNRLNLHLKVLVSNDLVGPRLPVGGGSGLETTSAIAGFSLMAVEYTV